ncbi:MAG: hydrolase [Planctomycetaceae bacterium]
MSEKDDSDNSTAYQRSPDFLAPHSSRLLIVDVQEKLIPHIPVAETLIENCSKLMRAADVLSVPITATEQYPRGLGNTVAEIRDLLPSDNVIPEKLRFSCAECLNWGTAGGPENDRFQIVVAGMEAHVCVQQTVLDLLANGYRVFVSADAVASRNKVDWKFALQRMADNGATITTTEAILFEWCEVAGTPEFKQISNIVTGRTTS